MYVIKHNKNSGAITKEVYPRIDIEPIVGLAEELEYFEITYAEMPTYNLKEFTVLENMVLTEEISTRFPALKIAIIEYELLLIPKNEVLSNFNKTFGEFIDTAYPIWQRVKDMSAPTDEGVLRQAQESALRETRLNRANSYINENIFPDFTFYWL
jgi:hypothetical protein